LKTQLPGNLDEIFPLKFRLREAMRFFKMGQFIVAEKVRTGQRYSLRPWQYELVLAFDGKKTFEEAAKHVYGSRPGEFTAIGLLNFYNWLYSENLVLCECESIFELVIDGVGPSALPEALPRESFSEFAARLMRDSRTRRVLSAAALVVLSLSVVRLIQVVSPLFEPPARRLYVEAGRLFENPEPAVSVASSERTAAETSVERIAPAARALDLPTAPIGSMASTAPTALEAPSTTPPAAASRALVASYEEPPPAYDPREPERLREAAASAEAAAAPGLRRGPSAAEIERVEALRAQLEECRIRRDEFYLQNDEDGYRREVHRMTNLAREIGDIENAW
jgi:hypothetical protein